MGITNRKPRFALPEAISPIILPVAAAGEVARTLADLEGVYDIQPGHISEAINYRSLDPSYWT